MHTGYCGMDGYDVLVMPDDATEDEIAQEAYRMAVEHAESYGIYPYDEYADVEDVEDDTEYSHNIEGWSLGEYDPEKHDMHRAGGGSFAQDFARYE